MGTWCKSLSLVSDDMHRFITLDVLFKIVEIWSLGSFILFSGIGVMYNKKLYAKMRLYITLLTLLQYIQR